MEFVRADYNKRQTKGASPEIQKVESAEDGIGGVFKIESGFDFRSKERRHADLSILRRKFGPGRDLPDGGSGSANLP
jgi:hypothetical protein